MSGAYKYRPQYTQNTIGPSEETTMSNDQQHRAYIERVAREVFESSGPGGEIAEVLERELGPLLAAGQAMHDGKQLMKSWRINEEPRPDTPQEAWDRALSGEREP
jgi:hypothetical protein